MPRNETGSTCAPDLHHGEKVAAEYFAREATAVLTPEGVEYVPVAMGRAFACCARHAADAIAYVMGNGARFAIVRSEAAQ